MPEKTPAQRPDITCTRRIEFDAAHRVMEHESKCKHLHGHRYVVEATFAAQSSSSALDSLGRVIDFGVIKERLGSWVDEHWDHTTILWVKDKALGASIEGHTGQRVFYMPHNPTAENMALYLFADVCPDLFKNSAVTCRQIKIYETPNCSAIVQG